MDFACNILKTSKKSKVFKKTNPWIEPIFSLMKELYDKKNLKKPIMLKIKILFEKNLNIPLDSINSKDQLKSREQKRRIQIRNQQQKDQRSSRQARWRTSLKLRQEKKPDFYNAKFTYNQKMNVQANPMPSTGLLTKRWPTQRRPKTAKVHTRITTL